MKSKSLRGVKVRADVELWLKILVWLFAIACVILFVGVPSGEKPLFGAVSALVIGLLMWLTYGVWYELRDDHLFIVTGPTKKKIMYADIKAVRLINGHLFTRNRIEVRKRNKGYFMGTTYIFPEERELFYRELKKLCPNLEHKKGRRYFTPADDIYDDDDRADKEKPAPAALEAPKSEPAAPAPTPGGAAGDGAPPEAPASPPAASDERGESGGN